MAKRKAMLVVLMLVLVISMFPGCTGGDADTGTGDEDGPIIIGAMFPLSGALALNGQATFDGADIARELVNDRGGVNGRMVEYAIADSHDANAATQEAERLIAQEKVPAIVGTMYSSYAIAGSAVAERNEVLYWEVEGITDDYCNRGFKYAFRPTFAAYHMAEQMLNFVAKVYAPAMGKKPEELRVALAYEDGGYGTSTANNLIAMAPDYGISYVKELSYSIESAELSSLVLDLKSSEPDVFYCISHMNDSILMQKTMKELDFNPPLVMGTTGGHGTQDFVQAVGEAADGVFAAGIPNGVNPEKMRPEIKELYDEVVARYKEKRNKDVDVNVFNGFNGAYIFLTEVLPKVEEFTGDGFREAALKVDVAEGGTLNGYGVKFAGPDAPNAGQNDRAFAAVMQWQDGKLYTVYPENIGFKDPIL